LEKDQGWFDTEQLKPVSSRALTYNDSIIAQCDLCITEGIKQLEELVESMSVIHKKPMRRYLETLARWRILLNVGKRCALEHPLRYDKPMGVGVLDFSSFEFFQLSPRHVYMDEFEAKDFMSGIYTLNPVETPEVTLTNTSETGEPMVTPTNTTEEEWDNALVEAIEASNPS
jgi:hypothetical protein